MTTTELIIRFGCSIQGKVILWGVLLSILALWVAIRSGK